MEYYVKSVIPVIESNYNKFTTVEKNIADFFLHNRKKVDFSAKAVSERLFVSEASLSRFAKKCGYSFRIVTLDGQIINSGGTDTGGSVSKTSGILTRTNEIKKQVDSVSREQRIELLRQVAAAIREED